MKRGRKSIGDCIWGPYRDGHGWFYDAVLDGKRVRHRLPIRTTEQEAHDEVAGARLGLVAPLDDTVSDAVNRYLKQLADSTSEAAAKFERSALLPLVELYGSLPPRKLTGRHVEGYLKALAVPRKSANRVTPRAPAMATQRSYFLALARLSKWMARRHVASTDFVATHMASRLDPLPWATKAGAKQINRGKVQLRNMGEAEAYLDAALALKTPEERVAAVLPLLTGVSSGELLHIQAAAVDLSAKVIHIRNSEVEDGEVGWLVKTDSRKRSVTIPECVLEDLKKLVADLQPQAYIFRSVSERTTTGNRADWSRSDEPRTPGWLRDLVRRVCKTAGARVVSVHGLRGTHASLRATVVDEAVAKIGDALGHGDHGKTAAAHYVGAAAPQPALRVVAGGQRGG